MEPEEHQRPPSSPGDQHRRIVNMFRDVVPPVTSPFGVEAARLLTEQSSFSKIARDASKLSRLYADMAPTFTKGVTDELARSVTGGTGIDKLAPKFAGLSKISKDFEHLNKLTRVASDTNFIGQLGKLQSQLPSFPKIDDASSPIKLPKVDPTPPRSLAGDLPPHPAVTTNRLLMDVVSQLKSQVEMMQAQIAMMEDQLAVEHEKTQRAETALAESRARERERDIREHKRDVLQRWMLALAALALVATLVTPLIAG